MLPNDITVAPNGRPLFGSVYTEERPGFGDVYTTGSNRTSDHGDPYGTYPGLKPYADDDFMSVTNGQQFFISGYGADEVHTSTPIRKVSLLVRARGVGSLNVDGASPTEADGWLYYPYPAPGSDPVGVFTFSDAGNFQEVIIDLPDSIQLRQWYNVDVSTWSFISTHFTVTGSLDISYYGLVFRPYLMLGAGNVYLPSNSFVTWGTMTDATKQAGRMKLHAGTAPVTGRDLWVRERTASDPPGPSKPLKIYRNSAWEPIASMIPTERWQMFPEPAQTGTPDDVIPTNPLTASGSFYATGIAGGAIDDNKHWTMCAYWDGASSYSYYVQIWNGQTITANYTTTGNIGSETIIQAQDRMWWGQGYMQVRPGVVAWVVYNGSNASTLKMVYATEASATVKNIVFTDANQYPLSNTGVNTQYFMLDDETFIYMQNRTYSAPTANIVCVRIPADGSDPYMLWRKTWVSSAADPVKGWVNEARIPLHMLPLPGNRLGIEWGAVSAGAVVSSGHTNAYSVDYIFTHSGMEVFQVGVSNWTLVGTIPSRHTLAVDQQFEYMPQSAVCLTANRGYGFVMHTVNPNYIMPYHLVGNDVVWDPVEVFENPATTTDKTILLSQNRGLPVRYKNDIAFGGDASVKWTGTELANTEGYFAGAVVVMKTASDGSYVKKTYVSPACQGFNRYARTDMVYINTKSVGIVASSMSHWNWLKNAGAGGNTGQAGYWTAIRAEFE